MNDRQNLGKKIATQVKYIKKAERDRPHLLSQTVHLGTLGVVMVLPVIGGAYLGHWLDEMTAGYSMHWTLGLLFLGVVVGFFNVYFMLRD